MRKSLIALCVAGALAAPMIAQADANLLIAQPALFFQFEVDQTQPVTLSSEVPAAIDNRLPMRQLETAVIDESESTTTPLDDGAGNLAVASMHDAHGAKPEVGWPS